MTLDALKAFGANARGVAIVYPEITDAELKTLADGGVRGIRFSLAAAGAPPSIPTSMLETIESLSKSVDAVGWHVQFNIDASDDAAAPPNSHASRSHRFSSVLYRRTACTQSGLPVFSCPSIGW